MKTNEFFYLYILVIISCICLLIEYGISKHKNYAPSGTGHLGTYNNYCTSIDSINVIAEDVLELIFEYERHVDIPGCECHNAVIIEYVSRSRYDYAVSIIWTKESKDSIISYINSYKNKLNY